MKLLKLSKDSMDVEKILIRKKRIARSKEIIFKEVSRHCKNSDFIVRIKNKTGCRDIAITEVA